MRAPLDGDFELIPIPGHTPGATAFRVLVPWAASKDGPYYSLTSPDETRERIDAIVERLQRGETSSCPGDEFCRRRWS